MLQNRLIKRFTHKLKQPIGQTVKYLFEFGQRQIFFSKNEFSPVSESYKKDYFFENEIFFQGKTLEIQWIGLNTRCTICWSKRERSILGESRF